MTRKVTSRFVLQGDNQLNSAFAKARTQMNDLARKGALMGAAIAAGIGVAVRTQSQYIDQLAKTSDFVGVTVESLQSLRFAAELTGVANIGLDDSLRRLNRRAGEFANSGGGPAAKAFETLGLSIRDAAGNVKSTEVLFDDIVVAMQRVETDGQRAALAAQLFGDDFGPKLVPLLNQGIDGINEARRTFEALHGTITETDAAGVERMNDALSTAQLVGQGLARQYTAALAPAIAGIAEQFIESAKETGGFREQAISAAEGTVRAFAFVADAVEGVKRTFQVWGRSLAVLFASIELGALQVANSIINGPGAAINWLIEQANKLPGVDIAFEIGPAVPQIQERMKTVTGIVREGVGDIQAILMAPLPGDDLIDRFEKKRKEFSSFEPPAESAPAPDSGGETAAPSRTPLPERYLGGVMGKLAEMKDKAKDAFGSMRTFAEQAARNVQDTLAQFIFDPFKDGLSGMLRGFTDMLRRMAAEIAAQQILSALFSRFEGGGGILGAFADSIAGSRDIGGRGEAGKVYAINPQAGPELFVPDSNGRFYPNADRQNGGSVTVNIDARESNDPGRLLSLVPVIQSQIEQSMALKMRRGYL